LATAGGLGGVYEILTPRLFVPDIYSVGSVEVEERPREVLVGGRKRGSMAVVTVILAALCCAFNGYMLAQFRREQKRWKRKPSALMFLGSCEEPNTGLVPKQIPLLEMTLPAAWVVTPIAGNRGRGSKRIPPQAAA
jgi:hypothetical protein